MKITTAVFGLLISFNSVCQKLTDFRFSECLRDCKVEKSTIEFITVENNKTKIVLRTFASCGGNFIGNVETLQDSLLNLVFEIKPTEIIDKKGKKQLVIEVADCNCPFDFTYEIEGIELRNPSLIRVNGLQLSELPGPLVEEVQVSLDNQTVDAVDDINQVFTIVEENAEPIGGLAAFYQFVNKEMKYPIQARQKQIEGRVFCEFVVTRDGSIQDVRIIRGIGAGCDEEAIRIIKASVPWNPGKQNGIPVNSKYNLAIVFKLDKNR